MNKINYLNVIKRINISYLINIFLNINLVILDKKNEMFYERLLIVYLQLEYWRRNILLDIISYVNKKACLLPQSMSSEAMHLNFSFINTKSPILFNGFKKYLNFILFLNLNSVEKLKCELNYDSNPNTYSITCKLLLSLFFIICSNLLYM